MEFTIDKVNWLLHAISLLEGNLYRWPRNLKGI